MDSVLDGLNAAQRTAVTSPAEIVQVLAPPGSGKTKTLTARVAFLLATGHRPWNILCLTFTIKSCREMRERIARLIGNGLESKLVLGTFHSVCRRYLVSYGHLVGIPKNFGIADSSDSLSIIKRIIKRLKLNIEPAAARSRISKSKAHGVSYAEVSATFSKNVAQQEFAKVFAGYETALASANLLDYDDLLLRCVDLLRQHPACVSNVEAVLIDEFQDTNLVQFDLMRLFAVQRKRITIVGDPDQSIYGFRSAEIKNLTRMRKQYPDTLVVLLEENYRSSGAILITALEIIQQDESRPKKTLLPTHCVGTSPVLRKLPSAAIEANWIVSEINRSTRVTGHLLIYSDFAILLRSASLSRHIESAMGKAGIPYRMVGGHRFFDRVEIKTLLDYLRTISQPDNSDAFARIINVPPRRIGESTIKALIEEAEMRNTTLWRLIRGALQGETTPTTKITKNAEQGISSVINIILTSRKKLMDPETHQSPKQLLEYVIKKLAFEEYLKRSHPEDNEARWANVEELVAQAADAVGSEAEDNTEDVDTLPNIEGLDQQQTSLSEEALSRFLAHISLSTELKAEEEDEPHQKVTISTIHAAKGLEWPVVFIPATYEGSIPHSRAEDTDEERRLLYVAMTRAKALLYMSYPNRNTQGEHTTLSPFLSIKTLASHLDCKGPSFTSDVIQSIARILQRSSPLEVDILNGCRAVPSIEDDIWPINDDEELQEDDQLDGTEPYAACQQTYKRRRIESNVSRETSNQGRRLAMTSTTANHAVTMRNTAAFSVSSTTLHTGFVSAGSHLKELGHQQPSDRTDSGNTSRSSQQSQSRAGDKRVITSTKQERGPDSKRPKDGQGSLLTFFAKPSKGRHIPKIESLTTRYSSIANPQTLEEPNSILTRPLRLEHMPNTNAAALPDRVQPVSRSTGPIIPTPQPLAEHRLRSCPMSTRPQRITQETNHKNKPYRFLSSSPPPAESLIEEAEADDGRVSRIDDSYQGITDSVMRKSDIRPATTFHTTTTAQVYSAQTTKKTLGVRRSMDGWASRGGHTLSISGRVDRNVRSWDQK